MKAARVTEFKKPLEIGNIPDPTPGPNDAVISVEASGICRSDWHMWQGDWAWLGLSPELPIAPGHEFGGKVAAMGNNVKGFKEGDRVTAPFHSSCGHCHYCLDGTPNRCNTVAVYGFLWDGGYAEYVLIKEADANLISLPDTVTSTMAAALGCRYMTGYHGVARGRAGPGEWVAVHGAGGVGLSAIQTAHAVGAQVIAVDIDDDKLEQDKRAGEDAVVNSKKDNVGEAVHEITQGGANVSIDALGIQETILNSILSLRKGGRHVQIGLTTSEEQGMASIPIDAITLQELEIIGSLGNPQPKYPGLLSLVSSGRLTPQDLVESEVSLEDVTDVFNRMTEYKTNGFNIMTTF